MPATYPATTFAEAVDLFEQDVDIFHQTLNGDASTEVAVDSGNIPSVRKALADMAAYKEPIAWANGVTATDHLQPRTFSGNAYVPLTVPVVMGAAPDSNWKLYNFTVTDVETVTVTANTPDTGNVIVNNPGATHNHPVLNSLTDEDNIAGVLDTRSFTECGARLQGYTNAAIGVELRGSASVPTTSDTGTGVINFNGIGESGGAIASLGATDNLASFQNNGVTGAVVKADGSISTQGSVSAVGDISGLASDERLKEDVEPIQDALSKVKQLEGVTFRFNEKGREMGLPEASQVGLIAQQVEEVIPEAILPFSGDPEYKNVKYDKLVSLLVEAIKELSAEVEELKNGSAK